MVGTRSLKDKTIDGVVVIPHHQPEGQYHYSVRYDTLIAFTAHDDSVKIVFATTWPADLDSISLNSLHRQAIMSLLAECTQHTKYWFKSGKIYKCSRIEQATNRRLKKFCKTQHSPPIIITVLRAYSLSP